MWRSYRTQILRETITCGATIQHTHTVCGCFIPWKLHNQEVTLPSTCTYSIHKNLWIIIVFQEAMSCEVLSCGSLKIKDPIVALYEWVAKTCYTTETFYNITLYPFGQSSGHTSNFYSSPRCQIFTWLRDNSLILWSFFLSFQQHLTSMTSRVYFRPRQQKKHHRVLLYFFCLLTVYMVKSGG